MIRTILVLLFAATTTNTFAQESPTSDLFRALKKGDSIVFEEGFNKCNLAALDKIALESLVFLHDQGGKSAKRKFMEDMQKHICSNPEQKPIRKLTPGSLVVYPLENDGVLYGAIQMGDHEFYIAEAGKPLRPTSTAKFITTWMLVEGVWKLSICHSFHHQPVK